MATNAAGNSDASVASAAVTPYTIPGAPTSPVATADNAQASVAFTIPTSNGGSAITGYTVTSNPGGFTASGTTSPLVVTGLTNGTSYTFTVVATNAAGNSVASAASTAVTPYTIPGAPTIGTATTGNEQASVAFNAPASNGGSAITTYTATSSPGGITATGASSPLVVTGLTAGTAYTFTVVASNAAGNSGASAASNAVTPTCISSVTFTYRGSSVTYGVITKTYSGIGTKCWLDRNLGATRVATSATDVDSRGHYFQWGRGDDGHQLLDSTISGTKIVFGTTSSNWICMNGSNKNWLTVNNNTLWQGVNGINNPCPTGFRVPTKDELTAEISSWSPSGNTGAYNSTLKFPGTGFRRVNECFLNISLTGNVTLWSSTIDTDPWNWDGSVWYQNEYRNQGFMVRCIKN